MKYQFLQVQILDDPIVLVTMNRPEKRNALSMDFLNELTLVFKEIQKHEDKRIIILKANGDIFCAGLDLIEVANTTLIEKNSAALATFLTTLYTSPLVTIAAVHGDAFGGGAGLAAACDLVVMGEKAKMGFPEIFRGVVATQVSTLLRRQILMRHVRELLLTGEILDSTRAYEIGLVNRVVPNSEVLNESRALANKILKGGPHALRITKQWLHSLDPSNFEEDLKTALATLRSVLHSKEAKEGIAAFLERRPPNWL